MDNKVGNRIGSPASSLGPLQVVMTDLGLGMQAQKGGLWWSLPLRMPRH